METDSQPDSMRELLEETLELTRQNNRILRAMRREALIAGALKFVFWMVIIGGSVYLTMKALEPIMSLVDTAKQGPDFGALIEFYRGEFGP